MSENPVSGINASFGIGVESEEGVPVAADLFFSILSEDCGETVELHETEAISHHISGTPSVQEQAAPAVPAKIDNRVGMTCEPRFDHLPTLLGLIFGGNCGGSEYVPAASTSSFTVESGKVAEAESGKAVDQYAGSRVTKLTIKSETGNSLKITMEGVGRTVELIAGTTVDNSAWVSKAVMMHHGLTIAAGPGEIPTGQVYDIEVEIVREVDEDHFANSLTRIAAPPGRLLATGKVTVPFNNDTAPIRTKIRLGTAFTLQPRWVGSDDETFDLPMNCKATAEPKKITDRGDQKIEIAFRCYQDGATNAIEATLGS